MVVTPEAKPPRLEPVRKKKSFRGPGGIDLLEEAVHLLRMAPVGTLACYYAGGLPFVLGFLYFWADMSRSAYAVHHVAPAGLGLAALFIWMKCWQTIYTGRLSQHLRGDGKKPFRISIGLKMLAHQAAIQSTGLFLIIGTAPVAIHLAWLYAFFQSATVLGDGSDGNLRSVCRRSWGQARLWPTGNHIVLTILFLFGFFVFLNLGLAVLILPHLVKSLLGLESFFTRSGIGVLNTTFLLSIVGLTYLCVDPMVKAVYVLRCFYGASIRSGLDLKVELTKIKSAGMTAGLTVLILAAASATPVDAQTGTGPAVSNLDARELDRSISEVLKQRKYTWRLPREQVDIEKEDGLLSQSLEWLIEKIRSVTKTMWRWWGKLMKWWRELLPDPKPHPVDGKRSTGWVTPERVLLMGGLTLLAGALVVFLFRSWKKGLPVRMATALPVEPARIDPSDESVSADQLPRDEWLELARQLMAQGDFRAALRALYLATLAALADNGLITLAKYKSNLDYKRELARRTGANHREVLSAFNENIAVFERIWYGGYQADRHILDRFSINQDRIISRAKAILGAISGD